MSSIFVINGHEPYSFAKGQLNRTLVDKAVAHFERRGDEVTLLEVRRGWDVDEEVGRFQQADALFLQFPVNWMATPWRLKKYMDEVFTAGMDGRMCAGDGRSRTDASAQYGSGGALSHVPYMLSVTFNAPQAAFEEGAFFQGGSVDELLWPVHQSFRFFGMRALPTFSAHDVMKNPDIEGDLARFEAHLDQWFPTLAKAEGVMHANA